MSPKLSICIATFNRGGFIAETLDAIIAQLDPHVELIVVDGASQDNTASVVSRYLLPERRIRYVRESVNSGVDADYDKAVGYATGEYCWLMTDDDLIEPDAVASVLEALRDGPDLVVANSGVFSSDMATVLNERMLAFDEDREYQGGTEEFFADVVDYLSFIGGVIVKRQIWCERDRSSYYGSLFIHLGVLLQTPLSGLVRVLARPLIRIRYGNAMWTPRAFEIWMFKWPALIWGFASYSAVAKAKISWREPWRSFQRLVYRRAIDSYSINEYRLFIAGKASGAAAIQAWLIAHMPGAFANFVCTAYCRIAAHDSGLTAYDLARSRYSTWLSRIAAP
jgi:glycosyltransferase involved in cell wall biosynthesis